MAAPLEYDFRVIGRAVVEREIAALEKRFIASAARLNREFNKLATGGTGNGRGGSGGGARAAGVILPGHREYIAQQRLNHRAELKNIREQERASIKAAREQERSAVKAVRAEKQAQDNLNRSRQSIHNQRIREEKQTRIEGTKTDAQRQRAIDRQSRVQQSLARQRIGEERQARLEAKSRVDFIKSTVGGGVGRVANVIGSVGRTGMAIAGIGAAGLAASSISQAIGLDETSRRLSIASRNPGEKGVDHGTLTREFINTGIATGFSAEQIAGGVRSYVAKTGDIETAMTNAKMFATVAQGGDTDVTDIFNMAADMKGKLKLGTDAEMKEAFAIFSQQGKKGKFELKNMAVEMPQILSNAANAGMKGIGGARDIGAMMQMAMDATGNGSEATTAVLNMMKSMPQHAKSFQSGAAFGGRKVQIYEGGDSKNPMRNLGDIMAESISASRGDMGAIYKKFGIRGKKALDPMMNAYKEAYHATKGTDAQKDAAGQVATKAAFSKYRDLPADFKDVELDAQDAMKSFSVQMEIINTKLKDAIASQLFPEIVKLLPELEKLIPYVADATKAFIELVKFIANNPFKSVIYALGASIAYEMAKVGLGKLVTAGLTSAMSRIPSGGGGSVALPGTVSGGSAMASPLSKITGGVIGGVAGYAAGGAIAGALGGDARDQEQASAVGAGFGAGLMSLGPAAGAAGAALGLFADQVRQLAKESGGWDFWNADENLNKQAKEEAIKAGNLNADGSMKAMTADEQKAYSDNYLKAQETANAAAAQAKFHAEVVKEGEMLAATLKTLNESVAKIKPHTGDGPSPIKKT